MKKKTVRVVHETLEDIKASSKVVGPATYTAAIEVLADRGLDIPARKLFDEMRKQMHPPPDAYIAVMAGYGRRKRPEKAVTMWKLMMKDGLGRFDQNMALGRRVLVTLLFAYAVAQDERGAFAVYKEMQEVDGVTPDAQVYSMLIQACRTLPKAEAIFHQMLAAGHHPTKKTFHRMIHASLNSREAEKVLDLMARHKLTPDYKTYTARVRVAQRAGETNMVLRLLQEITKAGYAVDHVVLIHAVRAFTNHLRHCPEDSKRSVEIVERLEFLSNATSLDPWCVYDLLRFYATVPDIPRLERIRQRMYELRITWVKAREIVEGAYKLAGLSTDLIVFKDPVETPMWKVVRAGSA